MSNDIPITETEAEAIWSNTHLVTYVERHQVMYRFLFQVLWETGFRVSEALNLRGEDVTTSGLSFVPVKRRARVKLIQPVSPRLLGNLFNYMASYRIKQVDRLFAVTRGRVNQVLDQLHQKGVIARHVRPHLFRHSFGHRVAAELRRGQYVGQQREVLIQRLLHHTSVQSARFYLDPTPEELAAVVEGVFSAAEGE